LFHYVHASKSSHPKICAKSDDFQGLLHGAESSGTRFALSATTYLDDRKDSCMFRFLVANSATLAGLVLMGAVAGQAHGTTITFDSTTATSIVDQGGFTGSASPNDPFTSAEIRITAIGLSPVPTSVTISNILLQGQGITGSLNLGSLTFTTNQQLTTNPVALTTPITPINFTNNKVSFDLPGVVINEGAQFQVRVRYVNEGNENSSGIVTFEAVPEPATIGMGIAALGGLAVVGFVRSRRRLTVG